MTYGRVPCIFLLSGRKLELTEKGQKMTRKDYILIADVLKGQQAPHNDTETLWRVACALADVLEGDNPNFDHARFMTACGVN